MLSSGEVVLVTYGTHKGEQSKVRERFTVDKQEEWLDIKRLDTRSTLRILCI